MSQDDKKRAAARAALEFVEPRTVIGVGTGSTANHFIDLLVESRIELEGAVASSIATSDRLTRGGIRVLQLNDVGRLPLYVDGADEATRERHLIKGGGGALTREKIVAEASARFVCVIDDSKLVGSLGRFPLPVEVLPIAERLVREALTELGGDVERRAEFTTDNGNLVLDVRGLDLADPPAVESRLNQIPGTVTNGLFARRPADRLLVAGDRGVRQLD